MHVPVDSEGFESLSELLTEAHSYALEIAEERGSENSRENVLREIKIARLKQRERDPEEAVRWYEQAIARERNSQYVGVIYHELGILHLEQNRRRDAEDCFQKCIDAFQDPDSLYLGAFYHERAKLHRSLGEVDEAAKMFLACFGEYRKLEASIEENEPPADLRWKADCRTDSCRSARARALLDYADLQRLQGRSKEARVSLEECVELVTAIECRLCSDAWDEYHLASALMKLASDEPATPERSSLLSEALTICNGASIATTNMARDADVNYLDEFLDEFLDVYLDEKGFVSPGIYRQRRVRLDRPPWVRQPDRAALSELKREIEVLIKQ